MDYAISLKKNSHIGYKLLIANRGEIARRILKACREKNILTAVVTTADDRNSRVCQEADAVFEIDSFLNAQQIIECAQQYGAHLIHPGYGFLSENAKFAKLCEKSGITFIGPTNAQIQKLGSKESSKQLARKCGIPVLPSLSSTDLKKIPHTQWKKEFEKLNIQPPYLIKASGGGGGRGMRIVHSFDDIQNALERASHEALQAFHDDTVFVERYLQHPRHIEIQVFGNGKGGGVFFGERECSLQRRHQKVIEECPSSVITEDLRKRMGQAALALVKQTKYRGAGTVEFLLDAQKNFYFLEMNTRLQVEHPVTEMVYGIDLVHAQIDLALGHWKPLTPKPQGVALEARILAENPRQNFLPTPGTIEEYIEPYGDGIRVDTGVQKGSVILPSFDSMIAKLIVHAANRPLAIEKMQYALKNYFIFGITTNIPFLIALTSRPEFLTGQISTHFIEEHLDELNQTLISKQLINFLKLSSCRDALFATEAQIPQLSHLNVFFKQKFNSSFHNELDLKNIHYTKFLNSKGQLELNVGGEIVILEHPGLYHQHTSHQQENSYEIRSPMAGKIYDILIKNGDFVNKGDLIFIIESMKMQLEVRASQYGILKNVVVQKGDIVSSTNPLGVIAPAEL